MKKRELEQQIDELRQEIKLLKARLDVHIHDRELTKPWYEPTIQTCTCGTAAVCPLHGVGIITELCGTSTWGTSVRGT